MKHFPFGAVPVVLGMEGMALYAGTGRGRILFVDGDRGSDTGHEGSSPNKAFKTIQKAIDVASPGSVIYIFPLAMEATDTDPDSYAETLIIPNSKPQLSLIGIGTGMTQGGVPQIKIGGDSTTAMLDIRAPGCLVKNLGFNGADSTGGGIKLTDNGTTYVAMGTTITGCHFKNCKCHATHATVGGAIYATGSPWQVRIQNNAFYKNLGGIVIVDTSYSVPQDWVIQGNTFSSSVKTDIDADIYVAADGCKGIQIIDNRFATVDVPTAASGDVGRYISLGAGSNGIVAGNSFACIVGEGETELTFGAAGTGAVIPTTVRIAADNTGETSTGGASVDYGMVFRT